MNMMLSRRAMLGGLALSGAASLLPARGWAQAAAAAEAFPYPATRAFITAFVAERKLAGTLAAIGKGQEEALYFGAGTQALDSDRAVDADTIWRIYSMTKPITGIAAMMLIEDGKLRLDQPLADLIPAFARMQVQVTPDGSITDLRPARTAITIRHLLTHTAGLGYSIIQKGPIKDAYVAAGVIPGQVSKLPIPGLDRGQPVASLAEFAERLATLPLVYEPGTTWRYSVSLDLLGRVIEIASGQSFEAFLHSRLFAPLGMTSTGFQVAGKDVARLSTNYSPFGGVLMPIDPAAASVYLDPPPFAFGGAGLVSTARDYDRFLAMLLGEGETGGVRVMQPETARLAMSNLLDDSIDRAGTWVEGQGFGAGGRVTLPTSPGGEGLFGWAGAAGTIAFVDRRRGYRVGGYTQYMPSNALDFQDKFPLAVMQDLGA